MKMQLQQRFTTPRKKSSLKKPIGTCNYLTDIAVVQEPWPKAKRLKRSSDNCAH